MFASPQDVPTQGRRLALLVGVNEDASAAAYLAPLLYAEQSAVEMAEVLTRAGNFELFRPVFLEATATARDVMDAVRQMVLQCGDNDFLLFYFAGHGYLAADELDQRHVYLVTSDFDASAAEELGDEGQYLSLSWLNKLLFQRARAGQVLVILDCCYGGNMSGLVADRPLETAFEAFKQLFEMERTAQQAQGKTRVTLAAAGRDQVAWERNGTSVLTGHLLDILKGTYPDALDGVGNVTLERLQDVLRRVMPDDQKPRFSGGVEGNSLVLATHADLSVQARRGREQAERHVEKEQHLRTMFTDHSGFLQNRLESFVGRVPELAEVQQHIQELASTGGYLTITGQAGQGKSSMIAKLVEEAATAQDGFEQVGYHFIPLTPPPDYQVALLRNLMARLILKYDLSELYLASESRAALCEGFPRVLKEVAEKGGQEVLFVDGLDQLQADQQTGLRDLSFLPQGPGNPPQGIVFVLGTRPNDTLRPLELLKPYHEYKLPGLSREDFAQILRRRNVNLSAELANRFHEMLDENALYLDLVAKELATRRRLSGEEVEQIIQQIADDPENLFSLTIERLRRHEHLWATVMKPLLGLLLTTNEPLLREQLKSLLNLESAINVDGEQLNQGLERLGGLVVVDEEQRYSLFHLKFREYLREDSEHPAKKYVFDVEDERFYHRRFVLWCEQGDLAQIWEDVSAHRGEQGRRVYARQHYIAHLYSTGDWQKLFAVLDDGSYGKAKIQSDPSMRSYALELDLGRLAAASTSWSRDEAVQNLPRLWRYTLLRCSLASRADKYPIELFRLMLLLGQDTKALGLAELLTKPEYKAQVFALIASHLIKQPDRVYEASQLFARAQRLALSISMEGGRDPVLVELSIALGQARHWQEAMQMARSIFSSLEKVRALVALGTALSQSGRWQEAKWNWRQAEQLLVTVSSYRGDKAKMLAALGLAWGCAGYWQEAERVVLSIFDEEEKASSLAELGAGLKLVGYKEEAESIFLSLLDGSQEVRALMELWALGYKGYEQRVIDEAFSIAGRWQKARVLAHLGRILEQGQSWMNAERVIRSISEERERVLALTSLGTALLLAQQWKEAGRVISTISTEHINDVSTLAEQGTILVRVQQWEEAGHYWQLAESLVLSISDSRENDLALASLGAALARAKQWEEAERVINTISISSQGEHVQALVGLGEMLAQAQQWEEAERVINTISSQGEHVQALVSLGAALARAKQWEEAERVINTISSQREHVQALADLGTTLAWAQQWEEAERVIRSILHEQEAQQALAEFGIILAQFQQWQKAELVVLSISIEARRDEALSRLSIIQGKDRLWREAERTVRSIFNRAQKAHALIELGIVLSQSGRWQEAKQNWKKAEEISVSLSALDGRFQIIAELGSAWTWAGYEEEAERLFSSVSESWVDIEGLTNAVNVLHSEKAGKEVKQEVYSSDIRKKVQMLDEMINRVIQAQDWERAEKLIYAIPDEAERFDYLRHLVTDLVQHHRGDKVIAILQKEWTSTISKKEALVRFPLAFSLIPQYPDLGMALFGAFDWVDQFLQG